LGRRSRTRGNAARSGNLRHRAGHRPGVALHVLECGSVPVNVRGNVRVRVRHEGLASALARGTTHAVHAVGAALGIGGSRKAKHRQGKKDSHQRTKSQSKVTPAPPPSVYVLGAASTLRVNPPSSLEIEAMRFEPVAGLPKVAVGVASMK